MSILSVRRSPHLDLVERDGEVLLLLDEDRVVRLSGPGPVIWHACAEWTPVTALERRLVAAFGAVPDSAELTMQACRAMVSSGVLHASTD